MIKLTELTKSEIETIKFLIDFFDDACNVSGTLRDKHKRDTRNMDSILRKINKAQ